MKFFIWPNVLDRFVYDESSGTPENGYTDMVMLSFISSQDAQKYIDEQIELCGAKHNDLEVRPQNRNETNQLEYIYYIDKEGRHIPGTVIDRYIPQKTGKNDYTKIRLNHPDFVRDVIRVAKTSKLEKQ